MTNWLQSLLSSSDLPRGRIEAIIGEGEERLAARLSAAAIVSDEQMAEAISQSTGLPIVDLEQQQPWSSKMDPNAGALNLSFVEDHQIALLNNSGGAPLVAMGDPTETPVAKALQFALDREDLRLAVAPIGEIEKFHAKQRRTRDSENPQPSIDERDGPRKAAIEMADGPIIQLVKRLLHDAASRQVSDVHLEPSRNALLARMRVDGRLAVVEQLPLSMAPKIANRLKVLAGLDIAETRLPQDGRLQLVVNGRHTDIRMSTSPVAHGESIVLRILGRSAVPLELDALGIDASSLGALTEALGRPHGIILVTGPTGSGKTTTLYAALNRLSRPDVKILSVEDPVEIELEGVNQVQVRPDIGLTFASALRSFLRQDPDIMMVGEIRDGETAEIAMRSAMTGHLVLSTLHTNSAAEAFSRLRDIGTEPYLAASTMIAVVAQRLVRRLCTECRVEKPLSSAEQARFEQVGIAAPKRHYEPAGCARCSDSGYRGRVPIMEVLTIDDAARHSIRKGDDDAIAAMLPADRTLRAAGLRLVADGVTSLAEVQRGCCQNKCTAR